MWLNIWNPMFFFLQAKSCVCVYLKWCTIFSLLLQYFSLSRFLLSSLLLLLSVLVAFDCSFLSPVLLCALLLLLLFKSMVIPLNLMRCIPNPSVCFESVRISECGFLCVRVCECGCVLADFNSKIWTVKIFRFVFLFRHTRTLYLWIPVWLSMI